MPKLKCFSFLFSISLAYVILLDVVRSLSLLFDAKNEPTQNCHKQLLESSWCGLLSALSLLLDSSTDDASTENILKQLETFASFCGKTQLEGPRDAFLAAICKASLPPHYTLNVLMATPSTQNVSGPKCPGDPGGPGIGETNFYCKTLPLEGDHPKSQLNLHFFQP